MTNVTKVAHTEVDYQSTAQLSYVCQEFNPINQNCRPRVPIKVDKPMPTITTDNTLIVGKLRSLLMDVTSSVNIITWVA